MGNWETFLAQVGALVVVRPLLSYLQQEIGMNECVVEWQSEESNLG